MILVVDMTSTPLSKFEFVDPITKLLPEFKVVSQQESAKFANDADMVIITGNPLQSSDVSPIGFEWVRNYDKPVLGICAGMQAIGLLFGSNLSNCEEIGMVRVKIDNKTDFFDSDLEAYSLHTRKISLPKEFIKVGSSEKCIHIMKHKMKPIYTTQFHPEVRNIEIIESFVQLYQS